MRVRVFFRTPSHTLHHPATLTIYYSAYAPRRSHTVVVVVIVITFCYILLLLLLYRPTCVCVCVFFQIFFSTFLIIPSTTSWRSSRGMNIRRRLATADVQPFKQPHTPFGHNFRMQMPSAPTLNMVIIYYIIRVSYAHDIIIIYGLTRERRRRLSR